MKNHLDGYGIHSLPKIWKELLEVIIKFITLEGRYSIVKGYHFTLLDHFIPNYPYYKVNYPFFLFNSLQHSVDKVIHLNKEILIHQGLIFTLYKHVVVSCMNPPIVEVKVKKDETKEKKNEIDPKEILHFYSSDSEEEIVAEKKVNLEVDDDEVVNNLLIFKNHSMEEETNQNFKMEHEKMEHNIGEKNCNIIFACKSTKM